MPPPHLAAAARPAAGHAVLLSWKRSSGPSCAGAGAFPPPPGVPARVLWVLSVVRKEGLYHPINFRIWFPKPCKTAKFFNPLNVFPMVFVTTPFLVQKALKTANSEKCVFSCQTSKVVPEPPSSLVFRRKPAPHVCRAPNSVFCPEKLANSSPLNSSPLVTALSPLAFWVQKCAKLLLRRVSRGPTARRGPGSMSDSPPRWSVSPPSLSPLMSPLLRLRFLVQKALQTVESEESVFRVGLQVGCPSLQIRRFSVERRPLCSVLGRKSGEFPAPSMSPLVTADVTGL